MGEQAYRIRIDYDDTELVQGGRRSNKVFKDINSNLGETRGRFVLAGGGAQVFSRHAGVARREANQLGSASSSLIGRMGGLNTVLRAAGLGLFAQQLISVNKEFQKLNAQLVTVTGSQQAANDEFEFLRDFAKETPFQLQEVVSAFIKLDNLGLNPSKESLTSYGNTAAAMGKNIDQLIEAVADASVGEFERLKEFGIKSNAQGENIKFTFKGITTEVKKDSDAIQAYLKNIGDTAFAGGMDRQMETLGGAISNLKDSWDQLFFTLGEAGGSDLAVSLIHSITESLEELTDLVGQGGLMDELVIQTEMWIEALGLSQTQVGGVAYAADESLSAIDSGLRAIIDITKETFAYFPANAKAGFTQVIAFFDQMVIKVIASSERLGQHLLAGMESLKIKFGAGSKETLQNINNEIDAITAREQIAISASESAVKSAQLERNELIQLTDVRRQSAAAARDNAAATAAQARESRLAEARLQREKAAAEARLQRKRDELKTEIDDIALAHRSAEQKERDRYANELAILQAAREAKIETIRGYDELETQLKLDHAAKLAEIQQQSASEFAQLWGRTLDRFSAGVGDAFATAIIDQKDFGEAMRGLVVDLGKTIISTLVEIGVKKLLLSTLGEAALAAETAASVAAAGVVASAWATPAAMVSLASYGANSAPATAGITATNSVAQGLAVAGIAHGGLDYVPSESTFLLDEGERVLSPRQNKDLTQFLSSQPTIQGGSSKVVFAPEINVTVEGSSNDSQQAGGDIGREVKAQVEPLFAEFVRQQQRPGGMLNRQEEL
ncbi:tape measure protein [Dasania sp. GY-MA-18]|uniref:Tape measure protein n=1 Tax=Dasania phycosphaerae TaxID=2950436 RepID=A0A9J6RLL4_9GAMM|nr:MULTISPECIES: tape measure protein [Dasania]MCR8922666.1 tape measure protein [Dasania sp. GY-MA-18]MCZ0865096.1 tape measure protein [Dasania phycosphaerae]MCZ0868822.1 tape measure protein [Dasania phycosphaerae]